MITEHRRLSSIGGLYVEQFPGEWDKLHARLEGAMRLGIITDDIRRSSRANPDAEPLWKRFMHIQRLLDDARYLPEGTT